MSTIKVLVRDKELSLSQLREQFEVDAEFKYVAIMARGVVAVDGVLEGLVRALNAFNNVGLVVPKLLSQDGELAYICQNSLDDRTSLNLRASINSNRAHCSHTRLVDFVHFTFVVTLREVWQNLNFFDDIYSNHWYIESSLCFQIREMGYQCLYVPSLNVKCDADSHFKIPLKVATSEINRLRFKARWHLPQTVITKSHTRYPSDISFKITNHVLFLDFDTPKPDYHAGGYAAVKEMQVLQSLGYKVTFLPKNIESNGLYTLSLQRMGIECIYAPIYADIDEFLRKRGNEFKLIYVTRYHVAQDVLLQLRQFAPLAKIILMLADLHFFRELRAAIYNKDDEQLSQAIETREKELAVTRKVDLVLTYSDVEKAVILSHNLASVKVAKCPWVCDAIDSVNSFDNRLDIAFLGGFNHPPNEEAILWFVEKVWRTVVEQLPEATLRIYGSAIPNSIKDLAGSNSRIQVLGWVSDVASVYNGCRVFIAPLQSGAGIKGKVIGALAHGVPSVLSDIAVEGIGVCDEIHAFVASSPDEWVNRIMMLYTDQALWEQMSQHALSFAKRHYSLNNAIVEMKAALSTVGIEPILEPKALVWKGPWRSVAQI